MLNAGNHDEEVWYDEDGRHVYRDKGSMQKVVPHIVEVKPQGFSVVSACHNCHSLRLEQSVIIDYQSNLAHVQVCREDSRLTRSKDELCGGPFFSNGVKR